MATITSASSGNFSAPATWVGGVVPGVSDDAVAANGHVVAIDTNVTVISVQQAGTGKFTLGNGRTLTGNVIANAGTFTSGGTVEVTATTGNTATITGNVTGVSSTAVNVAGIVVTGTGALVVNGSVTGSAGGASSEANGHGMVYSNVTCSITINGNVFGGSGSFKRAVFADISSNAIIAIIGNVTAGFANSSGVHLLGTSPSLTVTGNVSGNGSNNAGVGILSTGNSPTITITGTVTGWPINNDAHAVSVSGGLAVITITGDVIGGSQSSARGVTASGGSATVTVTGNVYGGGSSTGFGIAAAGSSSTVNVVGSATGVSAASHAINSSATTNGVIFQGDMTDSPQGAVAVYTRVFRMSATNSGVTRYANTVGYPNGTLVSRVSPNNVTGMPAASNVRKPVVYGFNNELTGTMAVPSAQSVAYGVPVNNTTGTAEFDLGRVAQIVGLQVAAGKSV